jgi:hypothetical protein
MNEPDKSFWARHQSFQKLARLIHPVVSLKMLQRYLFCLFCLATVIPLFYAEEDLRGKHAWESYERQSKEKGIELDWRAYVPPPVPNDQNFALTPPFEGMFDYEWTTKDVHWRDTNIWMRIQWLTVGNERQRPKLGDWVQGHPVDLKKWQECFRKTSSPQAPHRPMPLGPPVHDVVWSLIYWPLPDKLGKPAEDVLLALSKFDPELADFRKASSRPQSRFPIHYDELPKAMLVHLAFVRNVARVLESGRDQEAFADVNLAFYCANAIKSDAFMISQFVRCHMMEDDLQPIWEGLSAHRWSEDQLKEFQRYFSNIDLLTQYDEAAKADRAFACGWIESLPDDPSSFSLIDNGRSPIGPLEALMEAGLLPSGWYYQNELSSARFFSEKCLPDTAPQSHRVYPNHSWTNAELFDKVPSTPYSFAFRHLSSMVSPQGFVQAQTEINLALVACALERFRMAHNHFPETLNALAPEFLEKLPNDIINGELLKYHLTGAGKFILYSVGWNEKDDGGTYPSRVDPKAGDFRDFSKYHSETGDWVWKYPD